MNKKILYIHHGSIVGGAPTSLKNLIIGLEKNNFNNLKVMCVHKSMKAFFQDGTNVDVGDIYDSYQMLGRVMVGLAKFSNPKVFLKTIIEIILLPYIVYRQWKVIRREYPDIVHLNSSIQFSPAIAAKIAGAKLVWHVREVIIGGRFNLRKKLTAWLIRNIADQVICISDYEARKIGESKKNNVNVIYNFVDLDVFKIEENYLQDVKSQYGILDGQKVAISLGGVSFRKGTVEIINAARRLTDVRFLIAGSCPVKNEYPGLKKALIKFIHGFEDKLMRYDLKKIYSWFYNERVEFLFFSDKNPVNLSFVGKLNNVASLVAVCDLLIFAGCTPHFPRPVYWGWIYRNF